MAKIEIRSRWTALILLFAYLLVSTLDYADALTAEAAQKEERAEAVVAESIAEQPLLSHPLDCDAWTVMSGTPGQMPVARCYSRSER